jgi:hypothetical protein
LPHPDRTPVSLRLPCLSTESLGSASPEVEVVKTASLVLISWGNAEAARRMPIGERVTALVSAGRLTGIAVETGAFD